VLRTCVVTGDARTLNLRNDVAVSRHFAVAEQRRVRASQIRLSYRQAGKTNPKVESGSRAAASRGAEPLLGKLRAESSITEKHHQKETK